MEQLAKDLGDKLSFWASTHGKATACIISFVLGFILAKVL